MRVKREKLSTIAYYDKVCDKCGNDASPKSYYDDFNCELNLKIGEIDHYGSGFVGDSYYVNLCQDCSEDLFFNILPSMGIKVNDG